MVVLSKITRDGLQTKTHVNFTKDHIEPFMSQIFSPNLFPLDVSLPKGLTI